MSEIEIIGMQAKTIMELESTVSDLKVRMSKASLYIICVGGPLNDNKLQYTKEQLVPFQRILDQLE